MILATTGHRPDKLWGGYDEYLEPLTSYNRWFLSQNRPHKAITGMALGQDLAFALACIDLEIPFIAALPFKGQESRWPSRSQDLYNQVLESASEIVVVSGGHYAVHKMYDRNKWMVDNCTTLAALWNGTPGGTAHCVKYAASIGRSTVNMWSRYARKLGLT